MLPTEITIRDLRRNDVSAAISMLNREVLSGVNTFRIEPIDEAGAARWWRDRANGRYPAIGVWMAKGRLMGWASLSKWSAYEAYDRTAEVSVWVEPAFQGRGLGKLLLEQIIERANALQFGVLLSRIESSNQVSIHLHERFGFTKIGTMHRVGEKFGKLLNVVMLERQL